MYGKKLQAILLLSLIAATSITSLSAQSPSSANLSYNFNDGQSSLPRSVLTVNRDSTTWHFKVLRNFSDIVVKTYYWNYESANWTLLLDVPVDLDHKDYMVEIPANGLLSSPLRTKVYVKNGGAVSGEYFEGNIKWPSITSYEPSSYSCDGTFRLGHECWRAVDGDSSVLSSAIPDAYNDSISVIENYTTPDGVGSGTWHFKVLRNFSDIAVRAFYWNYDLVAWSLLYEVPVNLNYTDYSINIPDSGFRVDSTVRTRMWIKNGNAVSGEYVEGSMEWARIESEQASYACDGVFRTDHECSKAVDEDWSILSSAIPDAYNDSVTITEEYTIPHAGVSSSFTFTCEGSFRSGHECSKAVDGDSSILSSAIPEAYNDSISVFENYTTPDGVGSGTWHFKVLRNFSDIAVRAYYWNYNLAVWSLLYVVPVNLDYTNYEKVIPPDGLRVDSTVRTRMFVKNGSAVSGEYIEGSMKWHVAGPCCWGSTGNVDCDPSDGVDISDLSALIDNLYISLAPLCCKAAANIDGSPDGSADISDLAGLIDYLYINFTLPKACM